MRRLLFFVLVSCMISLSARDSCRVSFNISGLADTTDFIARIHDSDKGFGAYRFDTIRVVNGTGVLTDEIHIEWPARAFFFTDYGTFESFLGNGESEIISGSKDDIYNLTLNYQGASWSGDVMLFNKEIAAPLERLNKAMSRQATLSKEQRDSIIKEYSLISAHEKDLFIENPNSWVTLERMTYSMMDMPREDVVKIYESLSPDRKNSGPGQLMGEYLSYQPITIGASITDYDIEATDQHGNTFRLSEVSEPYILLDFSSCYCGPCIMAAKEIAAIREKYTDKVAFINYSCDDTEGDWRKAVERDSITWPSLFDGTGSTGKTCLKYNISGYPTFFLFGPDRKLVYTLSGYGPGLLETVLNENIK